MVQKAPGRASRVDDSRTIAEPLQNHGAATLNGMAGPLNEGPQRKSLPPEVLDRFSRAYKSEFSEIAWYDAFVAVVNDVYRASNNGDCDYFLNLNASGATTQIGRASCRERV